MQPIETALLFTSHGNIAVEGLTEGINRALAPEGAKIKSVVPKHPGDLAYAAKDFRLEIQARNRALPAEGFESSLDGIISDRYRGPLSEILFRHDRHFLLSVKPLLGEGMLLSSSERLRLLRIAHAICAYVVAVHQPAAIHWRQSGQLLLGRQYLELAQEREPWVLFSRAVVRSKQAICLDVAQGLLDRPIVVVADQTEHEQACAAGLSFLRHAMTSGAPIPSGHAFAAGNDCAVTVTHIEAVGEMPAGYHLAFGGRISADDLPQPQPESSGRTGLGALQTALRRKNKTTNPEIWAGALLMVVMPPAGLLMLAINQFGGVGLFRSAMATLGSLMIGLFVAGWLVLGETERFAENVDHMMLAQVQN